MQIPQINWVKFARTLIEHRQFYSHQKKFITKTYGVSHWTLYRAECGERICVQNYLAICAYLEIEPYRFYVGKHPSTNGR